MIRIITKTTVLVFIILLLNLTIKAQYYIPISVTGFNSDLVANGTNTVLLSTSNGFDIDNLTGSDFYQQGYSGGLYGLPANGILNSISNPGIAYHLADYSGLNALLMTSLNQMQNLTLLQPGVFDKISICATSAGTIGVSTPFTADLSFSDGTNTVYTFSVPDWFDVGAYAVSGLDRVFRNNTFENNTTNPKLFDCIITLNPSDKAKVLQSITFTKTVSNDRTAIFAICGITAVGSPPAAITTAATSITTTSFDANWDTVVGATNYRLEVSTDSTFSTFESFYTNLYVGNITSLSITSIGSSTTYYYRVRAENANGQGPNSNVTKLKTASIPILPPSNLTYSPNSVIAIINTTNISLGPSTYSGTIDKFSINPALPDGITIDSTTGVFTGVPTVLLPTTNFTITATNSGGSTTCIFTLKVIDVAPANLIYAPNPVVSSLGSNVSVYPNNSGGAITNYKINPSLPTGITLDTISGSITGIPTSLLPITNFTIIATNSGGSTPCTLTMTIIDNPPTNLSYPQNPLIVKMDSTVSDTPTNNGGVIIHYSINPALPSGLLFDTVSGKISGTPLYLLQTITYKIIGSNTGGSDSCTFTLTIVDTPPSNLHYSENPIVAIVNTTAINDFLTYDGGFGISFSITPTLPAGVLFDTTSGTISGTPTLISPMTNYKIKVSNTGGSDSCIFTLTVNDNPPTFLNYSPDSVVVTINSMSLSESPIDSGGAVVTFSISPSLPHGVVFNTITGVISGIPDSLSPITTHTITATNSGGFITCTFTLTVVANIPADITYTPPVINTTIDSTILAIPNFDNTVVSYSISPSLPTGISFDTITGKISGTPTMLSHSTDYSITAKNSGGVNFGAFTLLVAPHAPIADSIQSVCGNGTIGNLIATVPSGLIILWYNDSIGDTLLNSTTPLISGKTYYAEAKSITYSCNSLTRTSVLFIANPIPTKPILVPQSSALNNIKLCTGDKIVCSNFDNNYSYQWKFNTNNIIGQTGSQYQIPSIGAGDYSLYVKNDISTCNNISDKLTIDLYPVNTPVIREKKESNTVSILIVDNKQNLYNNYYWTYADSTALPSSLINNRQFLVLPPSNMNAVYIVNITDTNGCKASSAAKTVTLTKSLLVKVCPTINNGNFILKLTDAIAGTMYVKIFNQNGMELRAYFFQNEDSDSEYQINTSGLKSGLYNIEVSLRDSKQTQKMIIQKQ